MPGRLQDRVCIITGGSRGIGAASVRVFAREGARVVVADMKDDLGRELVDEVNASGGKAIYVHCDVTRNEATRRLAQSAVDAFGTVDVLFNNAGTVVVGNVVDLSEEDWDRVFDVNVKSMFLCSKHVVPIMRKQKRGVIINMSSES